MRDCVSKNKVYNSRWMTPEFDLWSLPPCPHIHTHVHPQELKNAETIAFEAWGWSLYKFMGMIVGCRPCKHVWRGPMCLPSPIWPNGWWGCLPRTSPTLTSGTQGPWSDGMWMCAQPPKQSFLLCVKVTRFPFQVWLYSFPLLSVFSVFSFANLRVSSEFFEPNDGEA